MEFGSRQVNGAIKREIWPSIRAAGFDKFSSRNAWRHTREWTAVLNFQSFNAYLASTLKCTPFSFAINLGVYYNCVHATPWASQFPVLFRTAPTDPPEPGCHARLHLEKQIRQSEYPGRGIWYLDRAGSNLEQVISDARAVIDAVGLPWIEKFTDLKYALAEYQRARETTRTEYVCAFGALKAAQEGSAIAYTLNDFDAAKRLWLAVAQSKYYSRFPDTLEQAKTILSLLDEPNLARPANQTR